MGLALYARVMIAGVGIIEKVMAADIATSAEENSKRAEQSADLIY